MRIQTRNTRFILFSNSLGCVNPSEESYANSYIMFLIEIHKKKNSKLYSIQINKFPKNFPKGRWRIFRLLTQEAP